jgi:KipI family sensor histidine kinase inhibitor
MLRPHVDQPKLAPLGEGGLLVFFANRISAGINARVHSLSAYLLEKGPGGIIALVPGYSSLLITFDPDVLSLLALKEATIGLVNEISDSVSVAPDNGKMHVVPVQYGGEMGPDFDDVSTRHDLAPAELIRLHTGRAYRVYFIGFLPGFGYLGTLPRKLATPRLDSPRARVLAGSVGIAGHQTAVYPLSSPGGWRIIGHTSITVWDPHADKPARFAPGDQVRFVQSAHEPADGVSEQRASPPARPAFQVIAAPGITTVQDLGRPGLAHLGIAQGGVFDAPAAIRANSLVGNEPGAALLEMTWSGPTLLVLKNATIALDGADLECRVDGAPVPPGLSWFVRRGSTLRFSRAHPGRGGVRAYLAVAGGIDVPTVLGARSTSLQAHFGGLQGRPLQVSDLLGTGGENQDIGLLAGKYWLGLTAVLPENEVAIRYITYRGRGEVAAAARRLFASNRFVLTDQADRMGFRFRAESGLALPASSGELLSFGVVRGAIQLPPNGSPVVLNVDHQTTGGYPLLGVVIQADWPLLAQLTPGTHVTFREVSMEDAEAARRKAAKDLDDGLRLLSR